MAAWNPFSASVEHTNTSSNEYGTRTPIVGQPYTDAYGRVTGNVNAGGATPDQQTAIDWQRGSLLNNPVGKQAGITNGVLGQNSAGYTQINNGLTSLVGGPAPQADWYLSDINPIRSAAQSAGASSAGTFNVDPKTGASFSDPYASLYGSKVTDPALAAFDYGTDRAFSALDARTAGAGAFGNSRSGLGYSDLGTQSALQRGQLSAGLNTAGLTNAFGLGQTDATRNLTGQTTNASNLLNNNQFNAGLLQQNNQFNAGQTNDINKAYVAESDANAARGTQGNQFNVGAQQTHTAQTLAAAGQIASNLASKSGIDQGILTNIVTANGVDTTAAQNLFTAGTITQSQLTDILAAAQAWNGTNFTDNKNGSSTGEKVSIGG